MSSKPPRRRRRTDRGTAEADVTATPTRKDARIVADDAEAQAGPLTGDELDAAILRFLRFSPNATNSPNGMIRLAPLADRLGVDPFVVQLTVERLADRGLVNVPFIEPGPAGGAELTQRGLQWLIRHEGGTPKDVPIAYQPASAPVRTPDEAARLPRSEVYSTAPSSRQ